MAERPISQVFLLNTSGRYLTALPTRNSIMDSTRKPKSGTGSKNSVLGFELQETATSLLRRTGFSFYPEAIAKPTPEANEEVRPPTL